MKERNKKNKIKYIALSGLFAAMIFIMTLIHVPTGNGYTHAGDGVIYLVSSILPMPYAIASAVIGGAMADGLSGFAVWMPATIVIKALTAVFFSNKTERIVSIRNILAIIPSLILCVAGYSLYEGIVIAGEFSVSAIAAAFASTPAYITQVIASTILYAAAGVILDKMKFKEKI